ncbi:MAG TPA: hypothetical protein VNN08_19550, partial [Thermoanaerobaculia bacterium]|nr:hypothetical protein [Thermoanaerobaculia bacterium]
MPRMGQKRGMGLVLVGSCDGRPSSQKTTVSLLPQALPLEILRRPPPRSLATLAQRLRQAQDDK